MVLQGHCRWLDWNRRRRRRVEEHQMRRIITVSASETMDTAKPRAKQRKTQNFNYFSHSTLHPLHAPALHVDHVDNHNYRKNVGVELANWRRPCTEKKRMEKGWTNILLVRQTRNESPVVVYSSGNRKRLTRRALRPPSITASKWIRQCCKRERDQWCAPWVWLREGDGECEVEDVKRAIQINSTSTSAYLYEVGDWERRSKDSLDEVSWSSVRILKASGLSSRQEFYLKRFLLEGQRRLAWATALVG